MAVLQPLGWSGVECAAHHKRVCTKNITHILYVWCEQAIIEWSWLELDR